MIPAICILIERSILQLEMILLTRRLQRHPDQFSPILKRMAAITERLMVMSRVSMWPTGWDLAWRLL